MHFGSKIVYIIVFVSGLRKVVGTNPETFSQVGDVPSFRILAPEFVCPSDEAAVIDKPQNTIIAVKTDAADLQLRWSVRWVQLDRPSQRFTLMLWKTVRALEDWLNAPQPEPYVYIIDNAKLLQGVEYIFNVTASDPESENLTTKTFSIDNIKGDPTLLIEGRSEKLSVALIAGDTLYADMEYVAEAVITTCLPTQDYYFGWGVRSSFASPLNDLDTSGYRLDIPPYSLKPGTNYYVSCAVYRNSGEFVTQTGLPLQVLYRGMVVSLNFDVLVVTARSGFDVRALVENRDRYVEALEFEWSCNFENNSCENFESVDSEMISFSRGLPHIGQYEILLMISAQDRQALTHATIVVVEPSLPLIQRPPGEVPHLCTLFIRQAVACKHYCVPDCPSTQNTVMFPVKFLGTKIEPLNRIVNEHSMVTLVANVSNVVPSCTLAWYFASKEYLASLEYNASEDCQDGEELSGSVIITSLEENFLNELTDFTNETEWRQMVAQVNATAGRARFVARCGCSLTFNCDMQGSVHADVNLKLNESPKVAAIKVFPETGTAMETVFRVSTLAASDADQPLRYSFYCSIGMNNTLILAANLDNLAAETLLPFVDATGTKIWVEVCDSLGACSSSEVSTVLLLAGEGRTMQALIDSMRGNVRRCEIIQLSRLVQSAITTYINTNQGDTLSKFMKALSEAFPTFEKHCDMRSRDYAQLLDWLVEAGNY